MKHIGCKRFGVQYLLKGLYAHGDLLYFHTEVRNSTHVPFDVDFVTFKIVDKKIVKRTAMQEQVICPLRAFNYLTRVDGKKSGRNGVCPAPSSPSPMTRNWWWRCMRNKGDATSPLR